MFVVYHIKSTMLQATYKSLGWAQRRCDRLNKRSAVQPDPQYAVASSEDYNKNVVYMKKVHNLMSGKEITIASNTPICCDPSSETYWST